MKKIIFLIFILFITTLLYPISALDKINQAIKDNDIKQVQKYLKRKINLNELDQSGYSPLYYAVMNDNTELIKLLAQKGADINYKILIDKGHNIEYTLLQQAVWFKKKSETIKTLVELGADVNITSNRTDYKDHLILDIIDYNDLDLLDTFIKNGADVNITNGVRDDSAPLARALNNNIEMAKMILNAYKDINQFNDLGMAPIHYVAGNEELLKMVIDKGADINLFSKNISYARGKIVKISPEFSPLYFAIISENLKTIKLLLDKGADIEIDEIITALQRDNVEVVRLIGENDPYFKNELKTYLYYNNVHPLYYPIRNNNIEIVKYLIKKGIDPNLKDRFGNSPMNYAKEFKMKMYAQNNQFDKIIDYLKVVKVDFHKDLLEQIRKKYHNYILTDFIIALIDNDIDQLMKFVENSVQYKTNLLNFPEVTQTSWDRGKVIKYFKELFKEINQYNLDDIIEYDIISKENNKNIIVFDNSNGYNWIRFYFEYKNNRFVLKEIEFEQGL